MQGSDDKRDFKCVERGVCWLRLDGLDTIHLNMNSRNCEIHSEAIKGTQFRSHSKSFILNSTPRNGTLHDKVQLLRPEQLALLGWPGFSFGGLFVD